MSPIGGAGNPLHFDSKVALWISPAEQRQLKADFLLAVQNALGRDGLADHQAEQALSDRTVPNVAAFYGIELVKLAQTDNSATFQCFLDCDLAEEADSQIVVDRACAVQSWHCTNRACMRNGDLMAICNLLKPQDGQANDAPARLQALEQDLQRLSAALQVWRTLAGNTIVAKIFHNASLGVLDERRSNLALRADVIDRARDEFLLRRLFSKPDLGYRQEKEGAFGFAGFLFVIALRSCSRALAVELTGRLEGSRKTTLSSELDTEFAPLAPVSTLEEDQEHYRRCSEISALVEQLDGDHRSIAQLMLAGMSVRAIAKVFADRGRRVSAGWVFDRRVEVKAELKKMIVGESDE